MNENYLHEGFIDEVKGALNGGSGGSSDWSSIKNNPFTNGPVVIDLSKPVVGVPVVDVDGVSVVKVNNSTPSEVELTNANVMAISASGVTTSKCSAITMDSVCMVEGDYPFFIIYAPCNFMDMVEFPEAGIWMPAEYLEVDGLTELKLVTPIDPVLIHRERDIPILELDFEVNAQSNSYQSMNSSQIQLLDQIVSTPHSIFVLSASVWQHNGSETGSVRVAAMAIRRTHSDKGTYFLVNDGAHTWRIYKPKTTNYGNWVIQWHDVTKEWLT